MGPHQACARSSAFLDVAGRTGSLFAGFPTEAALLSLSPHPQRKPDGWFFGSLSLSLSVSPLVSRSLSLPRRHREGRCPWTLHFPVQAPTRPLWSTAKAAAASSASRLRSLCFFLPKQEHQHHGEERRKDTGLGHPGQAEYRTAMRKMSPNTQMGAGVMGRGQDRWAAALRAG